MKGILYHARGLNGLAYQQASNPNLCNKGAADESSELFMTIFAALFCNFCRVFSLVSLQHLQTEQQWLKLGSMMLLYMFLKVLS